MKTTYLIVILVALSIILSIPSVFADSWYVGKGLKQGDYFNYNVCWTDWHDCTPLQMDFWVKNQTSDGNSWNLEFLVKDGVIVQKGIVTIGTVTPDPTYSDPNISDYANVFRNTILWLDVFTTKNSPENFSSSQWNQPLGVHSSPPYLPSVKQEQVIVQAGSYNAWVIDWHNGVDNKIWVVPSIPFPVKAETWVDSMSGKPPPLFTFEMLEIGNSQTLPSQFVKSDLSLHHDSNVLLSPLKQMGIGKSTQNITCSNGLELIYKTSTKYPECVKPSTAEKLIKRGWGVLQPIGYFVKMNGFLIPYSLTGGNVQSSKFYAPSESIFFSVNMTSDGVLNVTLPRALTNGTCNERCFPTLVGKDVPFMVLNQNGQEVYSREIGTTPVNRTLSIHIPNSTKQMEIFVPQPI